MSVTLRPATLGDVPAVRRIAAETWPITYAFVGEEFVAHGLATWWSEDAVATSISAITTLVAEDDGEDGREVVGMGNLDLRRDPPVIWKLYVRPRAQGTGVGRLLLEELLARAEGCPVALEHIDGNDRAAAFYRRHGFVEERREPDPPWPDRVWLIRHPGA